MIQYKQGDLLEAFNKGEVNTIIHQCNCTVGMGAGIAKLLASAYEGLRDFDKSTRKHYIDDIKSPNLLIASHTAFQVHSVNEVAHKDKKRILNVYSQFYPGPPRKDEEMFDTFDNRIAWLKRALIDIYNYMLVGSYSVNIGIPLIASGLAADKNKKLQIKQNNKGLTDKEVSFYYFKKYIEPLFKDISDLKNASVTVYYL